MSGKDAQMDGHFGDLVEAFFRDFDIAFESFDGKMIAERYQTPYLACRADGSAESFASGDAVAAYFQEVVDRYRSAGVRSCSHHSVEIAWADGLHVLAEVTWVLRGGDACELLSWREAYSLVRSGDRLQVRASVDLDEGEAVG